MNQAKVVNWMLLFSLLGVILGGYLIYNALSVHDTAFIVATSIQETVFFVSLIGAYLYKTKLSKRAWPGNIA
jgi:drug/metabolite transporter (DMT)-like permease